MRKVIYSMGTSLDGFIAGPNGEIDWSAPDEELHRFVNRQMLEVGVHLLGRRLYETMVYWETANQNPSSTDFELEFARIWQELPKIVFSKTLERVEGNTGLAATLTRLGLIDEYRLFVSSVVIGAGTPYFPRLDERIDLELVETQAFGSQVVYLRYQRA